MRRTLMLLKQLHEAQKYILKDDVNSKRLALILLDNFVEAQLTAKTKVQFTFDNWRCYTFKRMNMNNPEHHYSKKQQEKAMKYHDVLLEVAVSEGFVEQEDSLLMKFAHERRNLSYHSFVEEETLTKVGVYLLYSMICKYQPKWGNGEAFVAYCSEDPLESEFLVFDVDIVGHFFNWEKDWGKFLERFFRVESLENYYAQQALSEYILDVLDRTKKSIEFIKRTLGDSCDLNALLCEYYFDEMRRSVITESGLDTTERDKLIQSMRENHKKAFHKKSARHINNLERRAKELQNMKITDAVQKYGALYAEVDYVHTAFSGISSDIDNEIQLQIDIARGK